MRSKGMVVVGLSSLLLGATYVGIRLPEEPDFVWKAKAETTPTSTKCFPTGLRLSVQQRPNMEVVAVTSTLSVGARQRELGGGEGAHMLEHLWFQSKPNGVAVWDQLRAMGAEFNAFTAADVTVYTTSARKQELKSVLALEMARLRDPLVAVDQNAVDREALVVASEARLRGIQYWVDTPVFNDALYPEGHVYHGATKEKRAPDLASLTELGQEYGHETASLLVVGDVTPEQVLAILLEVEPRLGEVVQGDEVTCYAPSGRARRPPTPVAEHAGRVPGRGLQPGVGVAWTLPGAWAGQDALAAYVSQVLERNIETIRAERYYGTEIRHDAFDAMHQCGIVQRQFGSVLACEIYGQGRGRDGTLNANFVANVRRDVHSALGQVAMPPGELNFVSDLELADRQMTQIELLNGFRAMGDVSSPLFGEMAPFVHLHFQGYHDYAASNLDALYQVTPDQVAEFASNYLTPERMVSIEFTPGLESVANSAQRPDTQEERTPVPLNPGLASKVVTLPPVVEGLTSGGLKVLVLSQPDASQARVRLRFLGPASQEPRPWVDELLHTSVGHVKEPWVGGTPLKARTIGIEVGYGLDNAGPYWELRGSAENLEQMLYLMRALTLQFETYAQAAAGWEVDLIDTYLRTDAGTLMNAVLFPGTPLGKRAKSEASVSGTMIKKRSKRIYDPANAALEIVGGVDPEQALLWSEFYLGEWETHGKEPKSYVPEDRVLPERTIQWRDRPWSSSVVRYSCRLQDVGQANPAAQAVLVARFQEDLVNTLRRDSGMTYYPTVWLERWPEGPTTLNAQIDVAPGSVGDLTVALLQVSEALPGTESQVQATRAAQVAHSAIDLITLGQMLHRLDQHVIYGQNFYQRRAAGLLDLKAQDLEKELEGCQGREVVFIEGFGQYMRASIEGADLNAEELESPHRSDDEWVRAQNKKKN